MDYKNIAFGELEKFNVLIEIPKGSNEKWEYDWRQEKFIKDFQFSEDFKWPFNYGEILGTLGGDGDRLDACVYSSVPIAQGQVVKCRTFGIVKMLDRGEVDDKILCVAMGDSLSSILKDITDFNDHLMREFKSCYAQIAEQKNKVVEIESFENKAFAEEEIKKSLQ